MNTNKIINNKLGLLKLASELGNVSHACKVMGYSRDTFYRYRELVKNGGIENLIDQNRRKANHKNRIPQEIEQEVVAYAIEQPAHGQTRASNELRKRGIFVSPSGVRCAWLRHNLESFKKRLCALDAKVQKEGIILTEEQVAALERKKEEQESHGEIETLHPGYLGSQDTFYVGKMKGVGCIYQQTFVDTYSKVAFAKLYTMKTPITGADLLNDRVLPFFEENNSSILRMLTDRGAEFCGKSQSHDYELYLGVNEIEHTRTKARHPQTNGICERFHKTILEEFYQVTFRKHIYTNLEDLQEDLDKWLEYYNSNRTHQGKMCCGRTPMETFFDGLKLAKEKEIN